MSKFCVFVFQTFKWTIVNIFGVWRKDFLATKCLVFDFCHTTHTFNSPQGSLWKPAVRWVSFEANCACTRVGNHVMGRSPTKTWGFPRGETSSSEIYKCVDTRTRSFGWRWHSITFQWICLLRLQGFKYNDRIEQLKPATRTQFFKGG